MKQITQIIEAALVHPQGNYVLEKVIDFGDGRDVITLTDSIFERPWRHLAQHIKHSKFAMVKYVKAVDRLVSCFSIPVCAHRCRWILQRGLQYSAQRM